MLFGIFDESKANTPDDKINKALRPETIDDYVGQPKLIDKLKVAIEAANERNEPLDHCMLHGNPGLGKTTIGKIISTACKVNFHHAPAPSIEKSSDIISMLAKLKYRDVLFIDEIHSLKRGLDEMLYSAMEDFKIVFKLGNKESTEVDIAPFCLVGATTYLGKVSAPLRDRFGISYNMEFYSDEEIAIIIKTNLDKLKLNYESDEIIKNIARRTRGIPRIANKLIRRVRDFAQLYNNNIINADVVENSLELEGIDSHGFVDCDKKYLREIYKTYGCGPVGIEAISATIGEDKCTVQDYIEPFLTRKKFIARTKTGRMLTSAGMKYVLDNILKTNEMKNDISA